MIDWGKGYASVTRVFRLDPNTWEAAGNLERVFSVSVECDCTDKVPLLQSGSMGVDSSEFTPGYYRIETLATQGSSSERASIATLWFEASEYRNLGGRVEVSCEGRSVLWPASSRHMTKGSFVPAGADGAEIARELLSECLDAPVTAYGSFKLADNLVFSIGSTYLQAAWQLVDAAGWIISVDGDGNVGIMQPPYIPKDISELVLQDVRDKVKTNIPNVYIAMNGDEVSRAENDDPKSKTSTANMPINDILDTTPTMLEGESLDEYAKRKLRESSEAEIERDYVRSFVPGIVPFTPVYDGSWSGFVLRQSLTIGAGITVSETAGGKAWKD